jgi:hypothetical protein
MRPMQAGRQRTELLVLLLIHLPADPIANFAAWLALL